MKRLRRWVAWRRAIRKFAYGSGVVPIVSEEYPEINGFYTITDGRWRRVPAWTAR